MNKPLLSLIAALSVPAMMMGWGQKGHDVTAAIAQRHLTPAAKALTDSLLNGKALYIGPTGSIMPLIHPN